MRIEAPVFPVLQMGKYPLFDRIEERNASGITKLVNRDFDRIKMKSWGMVV